LQKKNVSNIKKHNNREDLAGEYIWGDLGQLVFLVIFLAVWVLDSFVLKYTNFLSPYIPLFVKIPLAIFFLIVSGFLARKGLNMIFGETRAEPRVIKEGVFAVVRHPVYLGVILFYLSLWVLTFSLIVIFVLIIIVIFYYFISKYEEKLLLEVFGKEYADYMEKVPMLFPRIIK